MMPTSDTLRNDRFISRNLNIIENINTYRQTDIDRTTVSLFYNNLHHTIRHIGEMGGYCSCFSFAVFNDDGYYSSFNNYSMFKEILNCYDVNKYDNTLIGEWIFSNGNYSVYEHPSNIRSVPVIYSNKSCNINNKDNMYPDNKKQDNKKQNIKNDTYYPICYVPREILEPFDYQERVHLLPCIEDNKLSFQKLL